MITNAQKKEMVDLRKWDPERWTLFALAARYNIDHTTVMYHLNRPEKPVQYRQNYSRGKSLSVIGTNFNFRPKRKDGKVYVLNSTCEFKTYKQYLEESKTREEKKKREERI